MIFLFIFQFPSESWSQTQNFENLIEWNPPQYTKSEKENLVIVLLSGTVVKKRNINLNLKYEKIVLFNEQQEEIPLPILTEKFNENINLDNKSNFSFTLKLPISIAQIPISIIDLQSKKEEKIIQLNLDIRESDILKQALARLNNSKSTQFEKIKTKISQSVGFTFLDYSLKTTIPSNLKFQSLAWPSFFTEIITSYKKWNVFLNYSSNPLKVKSSNEIKFTQNTIQWQMVTLESFYALKNTGKLQWGPRFGLQYNQMPFLSRQDLANANTVTFLKDSLLLITLGGQFRYYFYQKLNLESFLKYEYIINKSHLYSLAKQLTLDGAFSINWDYSSRWNFGLCWHGQLQNMSYSNHTDVYASSNGSQNLLFSSLEAQVNVNF